MTWVRDLKNQVQEAGKLEKEFSAQCRNEYLRLDPMVVGLLKELGKEWYGKLLFMNKYTIETLPDVYFWGITRRGKGLEMLPQRLHIKLRAFENYVMYFALDAAFTDGPTLSANTADTTEESLKEAIVELISRT
jgi:hypothetical protein